MEMTYDQYIVNPMGIKNAVFSNREMYRQLYTEKLDKILLRELGRVKYFLYKDKEDYYIHMKIPSEVVDKLYYDTVIQFYTTDNTIRLDKSLKNYFVKFYSNDPSFVFTFAHAMVTNNLFIKDLESKMSREALKKVAVEKNPRNEVGYVKSLYFAYILIKNYGLLNKVVFDNEAVKYNKRILLDNVTHADDKIQERTEKGKEISKKKSIDKKKENKREFKTSDNVSISSLSKSINKTSTVSKIGRTKNTLKTKKI